MLSYINNLGCIYESLKQNDKAQRYCWRALKLMRNVYGEYHYDSMHTINMLGIINQYLEDYAKAQEFFKKAINISIMLLNKDHAKREIFQQNLDESFKKYANISKKLKNNKNKEYKRVENPHLETHFKKNKKKNRKLKNEQKDKLPKDKKSPRKNVELKEKKEKLPSPIKETSNENSSSKIN